jgi:transglutaminase-like putative cysteine protease
MIWGEPWGRAYEDVTDDAGRYELHDVPVASPRYVLFAAADGYVTGVAGRVDVVASGMTTVDFSLMAGTDPEVLRVKRGTLGRIHHLRVPELGADSVIPPDASGYAEGLREFLRADDVIRSEDPVVVDLARELLEDVPADQRRSTRAVAWAVFEWITLNIDHDGVYEMDHHIDDLPFRDVTSGIWQTITGAGWCYSTNFYDWGYRPAELIEEHGGICAEHSWLGSALLRALNIPARASVGSLELWAQTPDGDGYWYGLSTTAGRTAYREHGVLGDGFASGRIRYQPVLSRPVMHEDWGLESPTAWRETHPWSVTYTGTDESLAQAVADLASFEATGEAPRREAEPGPPVDPWYEIEYSDITISLLGTRDEDSLDVRFPCASETDFQDYMGHDVYWTNRPDCVTGSRLEEITNPPVEGTERWLHITFDMECLLGSPGHE